MQPTQEQIDFVKSQYPDRALYVVDAAIPSKDGDDEDVLTVLMTGPTRDEYKMFVNKMMAAKDTKDEADKLWSIRTAIENAALGQIRWPDRDTVRAAFNARPEMIDGFAAELQKAAGSNIELRSKRL
jgi:hypothetical protein